MKTSHASSISYLGPEGSWSSVAAMRFANKYSIDKCLPKSNAYDILQAIETSECQYAALALENSVEGFVNEVLDQINSGESLFIVDLIWLNVKFDAVYLSGSFGGKSLVTLTSGELSGTKVYAHPHALAQCRDFVAEHGLIPSPSTSNSQAVMDLKLNELALRPHFSDYDMQTLTFEHADIKTFKESVQDFTDARTAFVLLTKSEIAQITEELPQNRTFWQITPTHEDRPGTLLQILQLIDNQKINISSLNSRPIKGGTERSLNRRYAFYLILDACYDDAHNALARLSKDNYSIRYLGGWNE